MTMTFQLRMCRWQCGNIVTDNKKPSMIEDEIQAFAGYIEFLMAIQEKYGKGVEDERVL